MKGGELKNNIEKEISGDIPPIRAEILSQAEDPEAIRILSDVEGNVIFHYRFHDENIKQKEIKRSKNFGWSSFDVGPWTLFHIDRKEQERRIREEVE